jgi:5-formyltetrahydrofolate cyclo-ligase
MESFSQPSKATLRKEFLARRKLLSSSEITAFGDQLLTRVQSIPEIDKASTVAAYVSMGTELPTKPLLAWLLGRGTRVLVPRLGTGKQIGWSYLSRNPEDLERLDDMGAHRPDEPAHSEVLGLDSLGNADAILAPAFFVDSSGYRLGRGAGWYDQALTYRSGSATVIAVVYPWEHNNELILPHEAHDVAVDAVVTPEEVLRVS